MKVIVIGGGQVGAYIADLLLKSDCLVKVIENRENVLAKLKGELPHDVIIRGSGTEPNVLESSGIVDADVVAAVTGADETNLVASTIAKFEFAVPRVIARVNNPKNSWLFDSGMGVDVRISQADLMAHIVVEQMDLKNMLTLMKISTGDCSIVQLAVDAASEAVGRPVKDMIIPQDSLLIAILRGNDVIIPRGDTIVCANDKILALTDEDSQVVLNKLFGPFSRIG
ncbi:NAD-binding protein [Eubacteriales bacterium mix99]|jgi:trk system potassium uptake protein TrkA|nr:potassium transporter TrkA [Clostridiales bacterium]